MLRHFGLLAQLVEQWPLNPSVVGSSPTQPITQNTKVTHYEDACHDQR